MRAKRQNFRRFSGEFSASSKTAFYFCSSSTLHDDSDSSSFSSSMHTIRFRKYLQHSCLTLTTRGTRPLYSGRQATTSRRGPPAVVKGCPARWHYSQLVSFAYDTRIELVNSNGHLRGLVPRRDFTLVPRIPLPRLFVKRRVVLVLSLTSVSPACLNVDSVS